MPLQVSPDQTGFDPAPKPVLSKDEGPGEKSRFQLPFEEQIAFFRGKDGLDIHTEHWDDILKSAHDRGFMVAGAAKADLLTDLHGAVQRTIEEGKSLQWFRQNFDAIVQKHGWDYRGERGWRTRVIYQTNLATSYAAGRYRQLTDPDLLQSRPWWKYVHNDTVTHPRPLHVSWNGLTLRHDDPWWQAHFPPNGWGCRCRVTAVAEPDGERDRAPDDGTYEKVDRWGEIHTIPKGIDYGWDYAPGNAWVGKLIMDKAATVPAPIGARAVQAAYQATDLLDQVAQRYKAWAENIDRHRPRGERFVAGALKPEIVEFVIAKGYTPETAAISLGDAQYAHFHRDMKADQLPDWLSAELPGRLDRPLAVLWDLQGLDQGKPPALIYVFHAPGTNEFAKVVVQIGYKAKDHVAGKRTRIVTNGITTSGLAGGDTLRDKTALELVWGQWP